MNCNTKAGKSAKKIDLLRFSRFLSLKAAYKFFLFSSRTQNCQSKLNPADFQACWQNIRN